MYKLGNLITIKTIEKLLTQALLNNGKMDFELYEQELEEDVDSMKLSLKEDKEDYIFTITENRGHVAMILIEKPGEIYINEQARERLKALWPAAYEKNLKHFIPFFAMNLAYGQLPIIGFSIIK